MQDNTELHGEGTERHGEQGRNGIWLMVVKNVKKEYFDLRIMINDLGFLILCLCECLDMPLRLKSTKIALVAGLETCATCY